MHCGHRVVCNSCVGLSLIIRVFLAIAGFQELSPDAPSAGDHLYNFNILRALLSQSLKFKSVSFRDYLTRAALGYKEIKILNFSGLTNGLDGLKRTLGADNPGLGSGVTSGIGLIAVWW